MQIYMEFSLSCTLIRKRNALIPGSCLYLGKYGPEKNMDQEI